jgi:glutamate synthase (NADPH/NADH) small chain
VQTPAPNPLAEALPPLSAQEAMVESNRCLFCYDAPCTHACPTHIDVPRFIKKIATENLLGSARTIFEANLLGATCARVCPVQELCEGACVLGTEHKPISIGRLQRYAMDSIAGREQQVIKTAAPTGRRIAVIGSGPAGLSCAGELARRGHSVTIFEKRQLAGGLSTFGIIAVREPLDVALAEAQMIQSLGVRIETGAELGGNVELADLQQRFDAVFLGIGLGSTPMLNIPGEQFIEDGLLYVERSKLDPANFSRGEKVVVIGAGNTAIDCATIAKRLGAAQVTMVYRRSAREMTAYPHEFDFVKKEGVEIRFLTQPVRVETHDGRVTGIVCVAMELDPSSAGRALARPSGGPEFVIAADQIVKAIGQQKPSIAARLGLQTDGGFLRVNEHFETSLPGVYAGGDCIRAKNAASTVMAVQDGKLSAAAIHERIMRQAHG